MKKIKAKPCIVTYEYQNEIDKILRDLPKGNWDWPGADVVNKRLQEAATYFATGKHTHSCPDHLYTMAILGSGDEETCKYWVAVCIRNKWVASLNR